MVARISTPFGVVPVQPAERASRLQLGETIEARVARHLGQNSLRVATSAFHLDLDVETLLPVGTRVLVTLERGTDGPRYQIRLAAEEGSPGASIRAANLASSSAVTGRANESGLTGKLQAGLPKLVAEQSGYAPLFASLAALQGAGGAGLPAPAQVAIAALLGLRLSAEPLLDAQALRKALKSAGIFALSSSDSDETLRSGLVALRDTLAASGFEKAAADSEPPDLPSLNRHPRGQPPAHLAYAVYSAINACNLPSLVAHLLAEVEGALSRLTLSALASVGALNDPDGGGGAAPFDVTLELPIALGSETAVLHLQIGRDEAEGATADDRHPAWKLRFALDLPEIGAVEAMVGLNQRRLFVTLWVERGETLNAFRQDMGALIAGLADTGLEVEDLRIIQGRPSDPPARSGQFVNTVS